jgi:Flp pilus assembly pilin Flp
MKTLICGFVQDESGAISFEDGLTVFSLTVGFIAALALMNGTIVELYATIFRHLPGVH